MKANSPGRPLWGRQLPRRRAIVAALLGGAGALTACTALPTTGEVSESGTMGGSDQQLIQTAAGPADGAAPEEIVTGFLRACAAGFFDDFATARAFLTAAASASWQPTAMVNVYDGSTAPVVALMDAEVSVTVDLIGKVAPGGAFTEAAEVDHVCHYELTTDDSGQWRIAELPAGMLLSDGDLTADFAAERLYFLTPDRARLVPELRWLPRHELARRLIEALLEGPSAWLAAGVYTAVPEGAGVGDDGVVVENGAASVDLTGLAAAGAQNREQIELLVAQISATLAGVADDDTGQVQDVTVRGDGQDLGAAAALPAVDAAPGAVVGMCAGAVVQGTTSTRTTLVMAQTLGADPVSHPALGADGAVYALSRSSLLRVPTGADAADVILSVGEADAEDDAAALLPPIADHHGWVWTATDGTLLAVDGRGRRAAINASWLSGRKVVAFDLSAESARIVVRHRNEGRDERVSVAAVVRDGTAPTGLGDPLELSAAVGARTDAVVWYDPVTIAVLSAAAESQNKSAASGVDCLSVGGPLLTSVTSPAAVALTADRATGTMQLTDTAGRIWQHSGAAWRVSATDVTDIAYPLV
ncbi:LpqB family beta-propeller domain-containing protein [Actinomyces sp.]|uniref:LpqB family beta-propeller domain-containing protein n=1 Tax=Actinomyces sp. TaxID=29317 RepID=UPI0026DB8B7B|nr:LpqB family beta-propeller domain-containing protein [Actinomyces sp.]MDO4899410.1 LpqB family beta-propeller domain-containing protein [Actinomyces sp.]